MPLYLFVLGCCPTRGSLALGFVLKLEEEELEEEEKGGKEEEDCDIVTGGQS